MEDFDGQLLIDNPLWADVLNFYQDFANEKVERPEGETGPRWSARLSTIADQNSEDLTAINGQLIAYGWLTFQIEDSQNGLSYRISSEGKKALKAVARMQKEQATSTTAEAA